MSLQGTRAAAGVGAPPLRPAGRVDERPAESDVRSEHVPGFLKSHFNYQEKKKHLHTVISVISAQRETFAYKKKKTRNMNMPLVSTF